MAREQKPDVITLDVLMPGMDGWAVLRALKTDPDTAVHPRDHDLDGGRQGHRLRPGRLRLPDQALRPRAAGRPCSRRYRCAEPPCPVLVVEDDPATREIIRRTLEGDGWQVTRGRQRPGGALERVAEKVPDLILLDLMMPEMDGFEFVAELRRNEAWRSIPVVVVTAKDLTREDRERLDGYVRKIFQKGALQPRRADPRDPAPPAERARPGLTGPGRVVCLSARARSGRASPRRGTAWCGRSRRRCPPASRPGAPRRRFRVTSAAVKLPSTRRPLTVPVVGPRKRKTRTGPLTPSAPEWMCDIVMFPIWLASML